MERRTYEASELRVDEGDKAVLTGHAAVFETLSLEMWGFREKIAEGAFADTLGKDDIRALWNHDTNLVLGRKSAGTLDLREDRTGLAVKINPPDWASAQVETIRRGDVSQMSFGFRVLEDGWDTDRNDPDLLIRTIRKVQLLEVSPVTFPAYPDTDIKARDFAGAVRSMESYRESCRPAFRPRLAACRKLLVESWTQC